MTSVRLHQRNRMGTFRGLIGFWHAPVRNRDDYICSPAYDSFSPDVATAVSRQLCGGARYGIVGDLVWFDREAEPVPQRTLAELYGAARPRSR
jgi:hypothetical protein